MIGGRSTWIDGQSNVDEENLGTQRISLTTTLSFPFDTGLRRFLKLQGIDVDKNDLGKPIWKKWLESFWVIELWIISSIKWIAYRMD